MNTNDIPKKRGRAKKKIPEHELVKIFWEASPEAFFSQDTIAAVINKSKKTLECDRWQEKGIPYRKCAGRVLYRKCEVVAWIESHDLISC